MGKSRSHHMIRLLRLALFLTTIQLALATTIAPVKLRDLFTQADTVAIVRILSGDSENYDVTVYKAEVLLAFKGASQSEKVYFGPYTSFGIGEEYVVFLKKSEKGLEPKEKSPGLNYGPIKRFLRIMYGGFSVMPVEYACVFDGKEIREQCDYGVKLNPKQVVLPKDIRTFPAGAPTSVTNYNQWVRKDALVALLKQVAIQN